MKVIGSPSIDQFKIIFELIKCDMVYCTTQNTLAEWCAVSRWDTGYIINYDSFVSMTDDIERRPDGFAILIHDSYKEHLIDDRIASEDDFVSGGYLPDYLSYVATSAVGLSEDDTAMILTVPQKDAIVDLYEHVKMVHHL